MTRGARRLGLVFLVVIVPTAATLIWLGLRLLEQDRRLWEQRALERRQQEAETAARVLHDRLAASLDEPQAHGVRFQLGPDSITPDEGSRILWMPVIIAKTPDSSPQFFELDSLEVRGQSADALTRYLELARSPNGAIAAGALQRAARVYRGRRDWDRALAAYRRMSELGDTWLGPESMPADLVACRAACDVLEDAGRTKELARSRCMLSAADACPSSMSNARRSQNWAVG